MTYRVLIVTRLRIKVVKGSHNGRDGTSKTGGVTGRVLDPSESGDTGGPVMSGHKRPECLS